MPTKIDLTGKAFGLWTVLKQDSRSKRVSWVCRCACGNTATVAGGNLRSGKSKSCGCNMAATVAAAMIKHGESRTKEYHAWHNMVNRCTDIKHKRYAGRGISVCEAWLNSYDTFLADIGRAPSTDLQLDRIDNTLGYFPSNVQWSTPQANTNNRECSIKIYVDGMLKTAVQIATETGYSYPTVANAIKQGKQITRFYLGVKQPQTGLPNAAV